MVPIITPPILTWSPPWSSSACFRPPAPLPDTWCGSQTGRPPPKKKIAWLQCVGSRDLHHGDHRYCSAVCCMSALKQAMLAQEHSKAPLDTAIFFLDLRTPGKDFDKYAWRAAERGVRFIRSRVHSIEQVPGAHDLALRYLSEDGVVQTETFDLVVLSVGLEVSPEAVALGPISWESTFSRKPVLPPLHPLRR